MAKCTLLVTVRDDARTARERVISLIQGMVQ